MMSFLDSLNSVDRFNNTLEHVEVKIGFFGGRRYYLGSGKSVSLNDIIQKFVQINLKDRDKCTKYDDFETIMHCCEKIKNLYAKGDVALQKANLFKQVLTRTSQFFGKHTISWQRNKLTRDQGLVKVELEAFRTMLEKDENSMTEEDVFLKLNKLVFSLPKSIVSTEMKQNLDDSIKAKKLLDSYNHSAKKDTANTHLKAFLVFVSFVYAERGLKNLGLIYDIIIRLVGEPSLLEGCFGGEKDWFEKKKGQLIESKIPFLDNSPILAKSIALKLEYKN